MEINIFGCNVGSAGERKLHVQGDAGGKVSVLGGGSDDGCEINCNSERLQTDRQTDRETDRETDRQTDRQTAV
jgi:hypothetical protein